MPLFHAQHIDQQCEGVTGPLMSLFSVIYLHCFVTDVDSVNYFPDDFDDIPSNRRNESARARRRNRRDSSPRVRPSGCCMMLLCENCCTTLTIVWQCSEQG